jgi:hypothetical protein
MKTKKLLLLLLLLSLLSPADFSFAEEENKELSYWKKIMKKFEEAKSDYK